MKAVIASLLIALLAAFQVAPAHADERILDYHADIHIAADGAMTVAEHIRVRAAGDRIKHGICPMRWRPAQARVAVVADFPVVVVAAAVAAVGKPDAGTGAY